MELEYLWIDRYKNIIEQGFNFNPAIKYKYDTDLGKPKIDTIDENLLNIFPENIKTTVIAGENGSGKSKILEAFSSNNLEGLFYDKELNPIKLIDNFDLVLFNENTNSDMFKNALNINQQIKRKFTIASSNTNELNYKINNLAISFLSQIGTINSDIYFSPTHINLNFLKVINIQDIESLFGIMIIYSDTINDTTDRRTIGNSDLQTIKNIFEKKIIDSITNEDIKSYLLIREFIYRINQKSQMIFKYFSHNREYGDDDDIESVFEYIFENFKIELSDENFFTVIEIIENCSKEVFNEDKLIINYKDNNLKEIEKVLVNIHRGFFDVSFFTKKENDIDLSFNDLSDGEQQLLLFFSKLYYSFRTLYNDSSRSTILLIDEPDTFLHPNWQKKFFYNLCIFIENIDLLKDRKFHFIITTHSPFILSDIPTENIIFLKRDERTGNSKNISSNIKMKTFGSNIHTLLSDAFFMQDGLMGEFAKKKINEVIKFLNNDISKLNSLEEAQNIINLIGEPILKSTLKNMLNEKYPQDKKLEKLKLEKEKIEKEIQLIEGKSNDTN